MGEIRTTIFDNGQYEIGERSLIQDSWTLDGFGYIYYANDNSIQIGRWGASNDSFLGYNQKSMIDICIGYWVGSKVKEGVCLTKNKGQSRIGYLYNGLWNGHLLQISNWGWRYCFYKDNIMAPRQIEYHNDDNKLYMFYVDPDTKKTWSHCIGEDILTWAPFLKSVYFYEEPRPKAKFEVKGYEIRPIASGPFYMYNPDTSERIIGSEDLKHKYDGVVYYYKKGLTGFTQYSNGTLSGSAFYILDDPYGWTLNTYENGTTCGIYVIHTVNNGQLRIEYNTYHCKGVVDALEIDKDFNVTIIRADGGEKRKSKYYCFDDIYEQDHESK